jgi:hypothetical protein
MWSTISIIIKLRSEKKEHKDDYNDERNGYNERRLKLYMQ